MITRFAVSFRSAAAPDIYHMQPLTTTYLAQLLAIQQTGVAQPEQSYYGPLQAYLTQAAQRLHHGGVQVVPQPQHADYGVPDFLVLQGNTWVGSVEAKPLGGPLNHNTQQLQQYRAGIHNLLFTNFLTFRLFLHGQLHGEIQIADGPGAVPTPTAVDGISDLLNIFFQQTAPHIQSAPQLADALALRARFLRHAVLAGMQLPPVQALHNAYMQYLFPGISNDDFADVVAQTITYTLFAAWAQTPFGEFALDTAAAHLPPNIPLLQTLFNLTVTNPALAQTPIGLHVGSVGTLLGATSPQVLLVGADDNMQQDVGDDPVMYFYQPFLHAYSKRTAEARGVYYTPRPAVRAMVRIADTLAAEVFGRQLGLAGPNVYLLDPASGTGTYLVEAGRRIASNVADAGDGGLLGNYLRQRFIPNSFGFEFLAAPYIIAHLKLARFLHQECGLQQFPRLRVYLTNTLNTPQFAAPTLPLLEALAEENQAAIHIKTVQPLLVIIGNPPYSGHSENLDVQLAHMDIVEPLKWCDGVRVKQTKWVNNDYVKFIRWSQWRITESGHTPQDREGVIVMITDNSYLTRPTFRGMRRYLLTQFDRIHIINLHGNIRTHAPGTADENIFDIQQGVCIAVMIRDGTLPPAAPHTVAEATHTEGTPFLVIALPGDVEDNQATDVLQDLSTAPLRATLTYSSSGVGTRAYKYQWLDALEWQQLQAGTVLNPQPPFYFFAPFEMNEEYFSWPSIDDYMLLHSMCVTTGNDAERVFLTQPELLQHNPAAVNPRQYVYRPFDVRQLDHTNANLARARLDVMEHMYQPNLGLLALGQTRRGGAYNYAFITADVTDKGCLSTEANCTIFPLYEYMGHEDQPVIPGNAHPERVVNIHHALVEQLSVAYNQPVDPEQIFYYTYAVLNATGYQTTYEEQLKVQFPHIPFPNSFGGFDSMAAYGRALARVQLGIDVPIHQVPFNTTGNNLIEFAAVIHRPAPQELQVNSSGTTFGGITAEMWEYSVGTHQALRGWLEARNGRTLVLDYEPPVQENQVLIDDFRSIVRRVAAALPIHQAINQAWQNMVAV